MNNRFSRLLQLYGITVDFVSLNAVFFAARYLMQDHLALGSLAYDYFWVNLNASWLVISWFSSLYAESLLSSFEEFSRRTMHVYFYWLVALLAYLFFSRQWELSRLFITVILLSHGIMLGFNRLIFLAARTYLRDRNLLTRKVIILGYNETARKLTAYLEESDNMTEIVGYCEYAHNIRELTNYPVLAAPDGVLEASLQHGVSDIYTTIAPEHNPVIYRIMKEAEQACIRFRFIPDFTFFITRSFHINYLRDMAVLTLRKEPLEDSTNRLKKRILDLVVSSLVILLVLSWLVPLLGLLIYLESPGPIFFKQLRSGRNNKAFWCLKFRSMKINNEADAKQASKGDSRITRIGRFIRKTSLDEFPQFINVFRGEMSLVGPRPHMLKHTDDYSKQLGDFMVRHFIKPGITGWAQVNGYRGETKTLEQMEGRVKYDLWYLENWSLWLDLKILFLTAFNILRGEKNAF